LLMLKPKGLINGASVFSFSCITTVKDCATQSNQVKLLARAANTFTSDFKGVLKVY